MKDIERMGNERAFMVEGKASLKAVDIRFEASTTTSTLCRRTPTEEAVEDFVW